jgi:hypothetical protein
MSESELNWGKAINHLEEMKEIAKTLGWTGSFYVMGCNELKTRYDNGERTKELYDEIIDLH